MLRHIRHLSRSWRLSLTLAGSVRLGDVSLVTDAVALAQQLDAARTGAAALGARAAAQCAHTADQLERRQAAALRLCGRRGRRVT